MVLIEKVKQICDRLAAHGWRSLLLQHGLDITANNLKQELTKELPNINRLLPGFEDFALEGKRGIEPSNPSRSLLFHALASPNVVKGAEGYELSDFPTLAELETIENYVYGVNPPSLLELRARARRSPLAIVVFVSEYRPAPETVHRKHADMCFSRTGVARVGTAEPLYHAKNRGFLPFVEGDSHAFRVLPACYSAYIAIQSRGNEDLFGPIRFQEDDENRNFWIPLHKLFSGKECIRRLDLDLTLKAHHVNEKLRRIHLELGRSGHDTGWREPDISQPPFTFTNGIAQWSNNSDFGTNVLIPDVHSAMVEAAQYRGKLLTFKVPKDYGQVLSSSLYIPSGQNGERRAPEYVHARHKILSNGQQEDLNNQPDVVSIIETGDYQAQHYLDFTGDGWVEALCPQLAVVIPRRIPAYSLVTAPDFFPNCDQGELMDWWEQSVPAKLAKSIWRIDPNTLSDERIAPNLELKQASFRPEDTTVTAIVSLPFNASAQETALNVPETVRHSYLPDAAAGVFAPGWDVSFDQINGTRHLAAYGLGSPFPEDSKLCAALSTFWPSVAPDAARTFEPNPTWPTVSPLTDDEIGQQGNLAWDGVPGPKVVQLGDQQMVEYAAIDYVDYVENALQGKFSLALTGQVDVNEYQARVLAMGYVYRALGIKEEDFFGGDVADQDAFFPIIREKAKWSVLSFREVLATDQELQTVQSKTGITLEGSVYRFEMYRHGQQSAHPNDFRKRLVAIEESATLFVKGFQILLKRGAHPWEVINV
ncbi:hypothetical protein [Lyngbya aestuarii]|uniref:hypothetical protein n=1 Tax=Lyngbya aestuarii TaxID=118322 RepID=UPI00403DD480